ncbi:hypothetical protein [Mesorhizobium sp. LNJC394B00]|uniref:hypothetical protein n=1 Tax=Mesorhizobium sp. LNJC394B00 TaxID=1287274 RepID=UPI0012EBF30F|nr:hypothetical protein [Mesorhizobium sp. LNJC394B00]
MSPISRKAWNGLAEAGKAAVANGWAADGVFSGAVGPDYRPGDLSSILCVGQSLGPAGPHVRINYHQGTSAENSLSWMLKRERSHPGSRAFWKLADRLDPSRRALAWTNVCKIEPTTAETPMDGEWRQVASACCAALAEELVSLRPQVALFVTGSKFKNDILAVLSGLGYGPEKKVQTPDGFICLGHSAGRFAILTRHPTRAASEYFDQAEVLCHSLGKASKRS